MFFCFFLFLYSALSLAEEKITVVTENWHPYSFLQTDGRIVGQSTSFVRKTLEIAKINYSINLYSWDKAYALARTQESVLIYSIIKTPIREKYFHWFCPIAKPIAQSIYKLSVRDDIEIDKKSDFSGYLFGITRGTFPQDVLAKHGVVEGKNLQLVATSDRNLKMLLLERVDLIVEADDAIFTMLKEGGYPASHIKKIYSFNGHNGGELCMALNKKSSPSIVAKIKEAHKKALLLSK